MVRKQIEYGASATLTKSYARLLPSALCLMKSQALGRSYEIGHDSEFIFFITRLRCILIAISLRPSSTISLRL
jgi:hypothetical protein